MAYMKHPTEGNRHVPDAEVPALQAQGWVKWPRSLSEKVGIPLTAEFVDVPIEIVVDTSVVASSGFVSPRKKPGPKPRK